MLLVDRDDRSRDFEPNVLRKIRDRKGALYFTVCYVVKYVKCYLSLGLSEVLCLAGSARRLRSREKGIGAMLGG